MEIVESRLEGNVVVVHFVCLCCNGGRCRRTSNANSLQVDFTTTLGLLGRHHGMLLE